MLKRQWLGVRVTQGEHARRHRLLPPNGCARDGAEWLDAQAESGENHTLRLDWLVF